MRPWVLMRELEIEFEEIQIRLGQADSLARKLEYSQAGKVPVLIDGELRVWETIAIFEHLAERFADRRVWPAGARERSVARAVAAEMHAGFEQLRTSMPLNCHARFPRGAFVREVEEDIRRACELWADCRARYGSTGRFLFGEFTGADAMFAPVASRFETYGVALSGAAAEYAHDLLALPSVAEWMESARLEIAGER